MRERESREPIEVTPEELAMEVWDDESPVTVGDIDPEAVVDELPEAPTAEEFGGEA